MRISKKILAAVLAALMVIAMMPFTAFAATVEANDAASLLAAVASANAGDTVTLTADIVTTGPIVIPEGADIKIDLNGHSISGNIADVDGKKLIQVSGELEFVGSNGGCIYNTNTSGQGHAACQALTGGTVIVSAPITFGDSDEIRDNDNATNRGCGIQNNGGTLILNDGYYTACDNFTNGGWAYAILNCSGDTVINNATTYGKNNGSIGCEAGTLTVNGGTYNLSKAKDQNGYNLYACETGVIDVTGGSFTTTGSTAAVCVDTDGYASAGINISGGTFSVNGKTNSNKDTVFKVSSSTNSAVSITGGTFNTDVTAYLDESCAQNTGGTVAQAYVAKIGTDYYATVEDAAAASQEGDTITLVADDDMSVRYPTTNYTHHIELNGVTLDLNGHTITNVSHGTMWLCKNAVIKNGTFAGKKATTDDRYYALSIWGKNVEELGTETTEKGYNVTVENVTAIGGINVYYHENVVLKNCTCTGKMYYAVFVNQDTDVTIESGNYSPATNITALVGAAQYPGSSLTIKGGNFTVPSGKPLVLNNAGKNRVVISGGFYHKSDETVYTVPSNNVANGYKQDTTTGEVIADNDVDTMSITIKDNIDLNIYVADSNDEIETIEFSYNTTPGVEENNQDTTVVPATKNADGKIALKVDLAPAQIMDEIKVVAKNSIGETVKTIETSVADYCNTIINNTGFTQEMKDLAVSTLDYGKAASDYFDYNTTAFNSYVNQLGEADLSGLTQSAVNWYNTNYFAITSVSYVATSTPALRFYIDMTTTTENYLIGLNDEIETNIGTARFVKDVEGNMMLQIKGIDITNFNELIVVKFKNDDTELLNFTPITWVKMAQYDEQLEDLANAIGNYYLKSVAYFE